MRAKIIIKNHRSLVFVCGFSSQSVPYFTALTYSV
ncbi:hypothetical protein VIBHAR_03642 [Vibrio campbellii ATCC BAA-1116]|uniref:Uncharacterized protein n=1 Tax=Vibrio campbellii (strain ATCC BAA-1116) TaxID=2902295 RepID=A7MSD5_VIBC1|nr:hypothetical protein VIBHAR_03642 [Vibrio campbellii ATCC BAA-1116]